MDFPWDVFLPDEEDDRAGGGGGEIEDELEELGADDSELDWEAVLDVEDAEDAEADAFSNADAALERIEQTVWQSSLEEEAAAAAERAAAEEAARTRGGAAAAEEAAGWPRRSGSWPRRPHVGRRSGCGRGGRGWEAERFAAEEAARPRRSGCGRGGRALEAERAVAEEAERLEAERLAAEEARDEARGGAAAAEEAVWLEAELAAAEEAARAEAELAAAEEGADSRRSSPRPKKPRDRGGARREEEARGGGARRRGRGRRWEAELAADEEAARWEAELAAEEEAARWEAELAAEEEAARWEAEEALGRKQSAQRHRTRHGRWPCWPPRSGLRRQSQIGWWQAAKQRRCQRLSPLQPLLGSRQKAQRPNRNSPQFTRHSVSPPMLVATPRAASR